MTAGGENVAPVPIEDAIKVSNRSFFYLLGKAVGSWKGVGVVLVVVGKTGLSCLTLVESAVSFSRPNFSSGWDLLPPFLISLRGEISLFQNEFIFRYLSSHPFPLGWDVCCFLNISLCKSFYIFKKSCRCRRSLNKVCSCF